MVPIVKLTQRGVMGLFGWFKTAVRTTNTEAPAGAASGGADASDDDYMECSEREVHSAALDVIWEEGLRCENARWGGSVADCDRAEQNIARCRIKYAQCQPKRIREHVFEWLDYYARAARENRADLATRESVRKAKRDDDAYNVRQARQAECSRRVQNKIRLT